MSGPHTVMPGAYGRGDVGTLVAVAAGVPLAGAVLLPGDYRVAATLGIVQGLSEFLPISSSAHLSVVPWLLGWTGSRYEFFDSQTFHVALHTGTLLALVVVFWPDWMELGRHAGRPETPEGKLFWQLVLASVPGAALGFVLDTYAENYFRAKLLIVAAALASMGLLLYVADSWAPERDDLSQIPWTAALLIGVAQAAALVPGVSRSGATMTMGRALGLKRESAARFSFLMATPITFGAGLLKLRKLMAAQLTPPFWLGILTAFLAGMPAIGSLLRFLRHRGNSFLPFAVYRGGLAAVVVAVLVLRRSPNASPSVCYTGVPERKAWRRKRLVSLLLRLQRRSIWPKKCA